MNAILAAAVLAFAGKAWGTEFLDHGKLLANVEDAQWFERNVPLLDVPDEQIQGVYYYRWQSFKQHQVYSGAQYGYLSSEFLHPVGYGAPYGGIVAAAGHHINEGRWLRDLKYGQDLLNYWLAGPGQFPKPATEDLNKDTYDWAHEYSFWAASSAWNQYLVTGDKDFIVNQLDNLVKQYTGWDNHFNESLGLYWQYPVWDASEYTAASFESSDPYHGGAGYRPTINAYQYGDARAIASIAQLKGDSSLADDYNKKADALQAALQEHLWDNDRSFFMHQARDDNPSGALLTHREIMGYVPWMFHMPNDTSYTAAFDYLKDEQGFLADFGPTTVERRSKWFMYETENCCRWNGPSWPFATAQTLTAIENMLNDYPDQEHISKSDYAGFLKAYAATQFKDGKPYVAEAHHPDEDNWMYDGENHSEDYNHSTFVDNVLAGLIGLRPQADGSLIVNPLAPSSWEYFAVENAAYRGHSVTVIWDSTGSHYNQGKGLSIFVDDKLAGSSDTLSSITVDVGDAKVADIPQTVNIAANGQEFSQLSTAFASYTYGDDDAARAIDGIVWRTGIPENSRWTSYKSPNSEDHVGIDFHRSQSVCDVRLYFYDDGGGVRIPETYDLQYWTGSEWATVEDQSRSDPSPGSNAETIITFPAISTSQLRVVASNPGNGNGWGLSEFEVWTAPIFKIHNENSGKIMAVEDVSTSAEARVQQYEDNGSKDQFWRLVSAPGGWVKIQNLNSGLALGIADGSADNSAQLLQRDDDGGDDKLWRLVAEKDGLFLIQNKHSGKVVGIDEMSKDNSANVVQFEDNDSPDHLWSILPAVSEGCSTK
ncbi:hypothetical protein N3K66_007244 [Trichothecium roseum]|uniref:Uncharacterized protein n=1 Tax=Trichothecium roseum TaxID=47278 RepID=A0ACC0UTH8_9HYPO|nr:hypothetical protein N3K66_007244 [Trichothecium roseum]